MLGGIPRNRDRVWDARRILVDISELQSLRPTYHCMHSKRPSGNMHMRTHPKHIPFLIPHGVSLIKLGPWALLSSCSFLFLTVPLCSLMFLPVPLSVPHCFLCSSLFLSVPHSSSLRIKTKKHRKTLLIIIIWTLPSCPDRAH